MRPETAHARELRRNMSEPEVMLWARLKRLRERGWPFRRQYPFRGYFLDFACLSQGLVVEVDGSQHGEEVRSEHDFVRDRILERHGFRVLRFWASDVRRNIGSVMDRILRELETGVQSRDDAWTRLPHPGRFAACPSPGGEGKTHRVTTESSS